jgi:xylan 1,4-beta-xylosidase
MKGAKLEAASLAEADDHVITFKYSHNEGRSWKLHPTRMEVSGLHHNVFGGFLNLKIGLYSAGDSGVRFSQFRYNALFGLPLWVRFGRASA